tara:strand:+ start:1017 stop:1325 length:309 start_codon:yes stop_codon:yes gene_type:complete
MIEDWRYDDGKMAERQICLTAFIRQEIPINREVYEFCNYYVSNGMLQIPDTQQKLEEAIESHNGDLYSFVGEKLFKEFSIWQNLNERQESDQEIDQESEETS